MTYLLATLTICLGVLAFFVYQLLHVDTSSGEIRPIKVARIREAVAQDGALPSGIAQYSAVWSAVGGVAGLRELRRNAILLALECCHLKTTDPVARQEIDTVIRICAAINVSAVLGIMEGCAVQVLPFIPRSYAVDAAKNYCILVVHWQNLSEIGH